MGKSTLFNVLTSAGAVVGNFPFTTIDPNVGTAVVPDARLERLFDIFRPKKKTPATMEFLDIAGLIAGASEGEGLGNQFLAHIREVDAVLHVLRCFEDPDVVHVSGSADPVRDAGIVDTELALSDLASAEKRLSKAEKLGRTGDLKQRSEAAALAPIVALLDAGKPVRSEPLPPESNAILPSLHLLTAKPVLYVANVGEKEVNAESPAVAAVRAMAKEQGAGVIVLSCKLESEIAELPESERAAFLADAGLKEPGVARLIREAYSLLGLISFLTGGGDDEVRAWPVRKGSQAPQAAGKIHSDIEKGFIRAEIVSFADLDRLGNMQACKEAGKLRLEGRDYVVQDGDVVNFRFSA